MQYYDRPEILTLKGDEAAEALREYLRELQGHQPEELTERQTEAMIRITKGLISAIEAETPASGAQRQHHFLSRLTNLVPQLILRFP
jgi:hypothetical protein